MTIYYVDMPFGCKDLNCAWSSLENAIHYFSEEAKSCTWGMLHIDTDHETYFSCECFCDNKSIGKATIYPTFLDEKPYVEP